MEEDRFGVQRQLPHVRVEHHHRAVHLSHRFGFRVQDLGLAFRVYSDDGRPCHQGVRSLSRLGFGV